MWAITSYFNPVGYKRRLSNYRMFRANLGVPLVTVELSFNGRFELTDQDADILIQLSGGAVLWQKVLALKAVPSNAPTIAWLDCDVILERSDWVDEVKNQLKEFKVVQLFSEAVHVSSEDYETKSDHCNGHAEDHGFYDASIVGSGDRGALCPPRPGNWQPQSSTGTLGQ